MQITTTSLHRSQGPELFERLSLAAPGAVELTDLRAGGGGTTEHSRDVVLLAVLDGAIELAIEDELLTLGTGAVVWDPSRAARR